MELEREQPREEVQVNAINELFKTIAKAGAKSAPQGYTPPTDGSMPAVPPADEQQQQPQQQPTKRAGILPTQEELQRAMETQDPYSLLTGYQVPRDERRRQRQQRIANVEAVGQALSAVGGAFSAHRGGPVAPLDMQRFDQAMANLSAEEQEHMQAQRQHDLMTLQQAVRQVEQKRQEDVAREAGKEEHERRKEIQKKGHEYQIDLQERGAEIREEQENQRFQNEMARIESMTDREAQEQRARLDAINARTQGDELKNNPAVVMLYDDQNEEVGYLRDLQAQLFYDRLLEHQEVQRFINQRWGNMLNRGVTMSEEWKHEVIRRFWPLDVNTIRQLIRTQETMPRGDIGRGFQPTQDDRPTWQRPFAPRPPFQR